MTPVSIQYERELGSFSTPLVGLSVDINIWMERVSNEMTSYRKSQVAGVILEKTRLWPVQLFLRAVAVGFGAVYRMIVLTAGNRIF